PLVAQSQHVSGVLRIEAELLDELRAIDSHLAALACHAVALPLHVAEIGVTGTTSGEPVFVRSQFAPGSLENGTLLLRNVQEQHHCGIAGKREPTPLPQGVDSSIDVPARRADALGLGAEYPPGQPAQP